MLDFRKSETTVVRVNTYEKQGHHRKSKVQWEGLEEIREKLKKL